MVRYMVENILQGLNIALINPLEISRQGLSSIINQYGATKLTAFDTCRSFLACPTPEPYNLVLIHCFESGDDESITEIVTRTGAEVAMITSSHYVYTSSASYMLSKMELGITGFLDLDEPIENFISELLHVAAGDIVVSKPFTKYLTNSEYNKEQDKESICEQLSTREIDILKLVSKGYTNTEIGKALNISPHTVKGHLTHILTKLDLKNRQQAVAYLLNRKALAEETG